MLFIIYALVSLLTAASAGFLYFAGYFGELTLTIFGFVFSTLLFTGIVAVLPWWVDRKYSPRH
ncbi:MAG TPA: hypothetical protein VIL74_10630 [Pyrinomonadaceae bacterium]|jgi:hypothetical protein